MHLLSWKEIKKHCQKIKLKPGQKLGKAQQVIMSKKLFDYGKCSISIYFLWTVNVNEKCQFGVY